MHAQPSSEARCLNFGWTLCLLAWAFAGRLCDKYYNLMSWLIYRLINYDLQLQWTHYLDEPGWCKHHYFVLHCQPGGHHLLLYLNKGEMYGGHWLHSKQQGQNEACASAVSPQPLLFPNTIHVHGIRGSFKEFYGKSKDCDNSFCRVLRKVPNQMSRVKRICVFEHSVITNFNCACPAIQRGQGSGFLSEGSSWFTTCMSEQRRFWRDCADAQARLNLRCSHRR